MTLPHSPTTPRLIVGCMTGTSIDALDAALVRVHGHGLHLRAEFIRGVSRPLGPLAPRLRAMAEQAPLTAGTVAAVARDFALLHADAIRELRGSDAIDLVVAHGQTVFHAPPISWQMINAPVLAHELRTPVLFDLRATDLAAGGQGAPITPLADWVLFRSARPTAVINLGGFCNATVLPPCRIGDDPAVGIDQIRGADICACNHLLDVIARELLGKPYDEDGRVAAQGTLHPAALHDLVDLLTQQSRAGRSLGTGDELGRWIARWKSGGLAADLAATACSAIAQTIATRLAVTPEHSILVAGGGARNAALVRAIASATHAKVFPTDARAVPIEQREAIEMAVLGALCQDRVPITLRQVTGASTPPVAGLWAIP